MWSSTSVNNQKDGVLSMLGRKTNQGLTHENY